MPMEICLHCTPRTHYQSHNIPAHMATTVPPGNHYKVWIPTMQAAINAALAGGSNLAKQRCLIARPLQCVAASS